MMISGTWIQRKKHTRVRTRQKKKWKAMQAPYRLYIRFISHSRIALDAVPKQINLTEIRQ